MNADELPAEVVAAKILLPAWFTERMMMDNWTFGLLMDTGMTLVIDTIHTVHQAADSQLWLDVDLAETAPYAGSELNLVLSPTSRTQASVAVRHVLAAFELADT